MYLQELPNICNIIIRTDIDNKKLPKDFWENKLHSEVLKTFLKVKKAWASFCLSKILNVRLTLSSIYQHYDMSFWFQISSCIVFLW